MEETSSMCIKFCRNWKWNHWYVCQQLIRMSQSQITLYQQSISVKIVFTCWGIKIVQKLENICIRSRCDGCNFSHLLHVLWTRRKALYSSNANCGSWMENIGRTRLNQNASLWGLMPICSSFLLCSAGLELTPMPIQENTCSNVWVFEEIAYEYQKCA